MPKPDKAERREEQRHKAEHGMRVVGRTTKSVLQRLVPKKEKQNT